MSTYEIGKEFVDYVIKLGSLDNDINLFNYPKNEKKRKKAGFSPENFEEIFKTTERDGKLVYELVWHAITFNLWTIIEAYNSREDKADEFKKLREYTTQIVGDYLYYGDYLESFIKKEKMKDQFDELTMGFIEKVKL